MVLHLAEQLEVPLRARNELLVAAGFAPVYGERRLDAPDMAAVRARRCDLVAGRLRALSRAVVVDRGWHLVAANRGVPLLTEGADPALLEPPVNVLRLSLHPRRHGAADPQPGPVAGHTCCTGWPGGPALRRPGAGRAARAS